LAIDAAKLTRSSSLRFAGNRFGFARKCRTPYNLFMPRAVKKSATTPDKDILKLIPASEHRPQPLRLRIGIHTSTAGGVETAAERAWRLGCNTLQIFSSSPRMWRPFDVSAEQCEAMAALRAAYDLKPLVIHANYLINVAGTNPEMLEKSVSALHAEMERAISLRAEYVVLHPGSFRGCTRQEGLANACKAIARASDGLNLADNGLTLLIENTAGAEFSLGSSFESVAELIAALAVHIPVASCIDTCHSHVRGYDIVSEQGYEETMRQLDATVGLANVRVWHCNDAKAACGSKLDRHESIGKGTIGLEAFRRLLHDPRHAHAAFILETPIDEPLDDLHNIETLKSLAG
jgi:deoxyribonuclease-4